MNDTHKYPRKKAEEDSEQKSICTPGITNKEFIAEMIFDREAGHTKFALFEKKTRDIKIVSSIKFKDQIHVPYPASHTALKNGLVRFPSDVGEIMETEELVKKIMLLVDKYVTLSVPFRELVGYYILMTWVFDKFRELCYLRFIGDRGSGKSRVLQVVGNLCFRPITIGGATTPAPIFRILDQFPGTLIIDEADFDRSDAKSDIAKIINTGFMKGVPVLRCVGEQHETKAFNVFGPKILAARESYRDTAIESRCLTEDMDRIENDPKIPLNLPPSFEEEVLEIRNLLLRWRFENFDRIKLRTDLHDPLVENRLNQISAAIKSVAPDHAQKNITEMIREYQTSLIDDRSATYAADVLAAIDFRISNGAEPTVKDITTDFNVGHSIREELTTPKVGHLVRKVLKIKSERRRDGYTILNNEANKKRIALLKKKYGLPDDDPDDNPAGDVNLEPREPDATIEDIDSKVIPMF